MQHALSLKRWQNVKPRVYTQQKKNNNETFCVRYAAGYREFLPITSVAQSNDLDETRIVKSTSCSHTGKEHTHTKSYFTTQLAVLQVAHVTPELYVFVVNDMHMIIVSQVVPSIVYRVHIMMLDMQVHAVQWMIKVKMQELTDDGTDWGDLNHSLSYLVTLWEKSAHFVPRRPRGGLLRVTVASLRAISENVHVQ